MDAYQIKVGLKYAKPAIWRKVLVPDYLTFSQLFVTINLAMGWEGYHLSEFIMDRNTFISDPDDYGVDDYGPGKHLAANTAKIKDYLQVGGKYQYIYDMGDNWEHTVAVEKLVESYEYTYPTVLAYKGDCPPEDCGGIYGFQHLDEFEEDERPEIVPYDMEKVNGYFREKCALMKTKEDRRVAVDIHADLYDGKKGFYAKISDRKKGAAKKEHSVSLQEHLAEYSKRDLEMFLAEKGGTCPKGANKTALVNKLLPLMLGYETMEQYFLCLMSWEINWLENLLGGKKVLAEGIAPLALERGGYTSPTKDSYSIPQEVQDAFRKWLTPSAREQARERRWIMHAIMTANLLYGVTPADVLAKVVAADEKYTFSPREIMEKARKIPRDLASFEVEVDGICSKNLVLPRDELLKLQGDAPYYYPTREEIVEGPQTWLMANMPAQVLLRFLVDVLNAPMEVAYEQIVRLGLMVNSGVPMGPVVDEIGKKMPMASNEEMEKAQKKFYDFIDNTRSILYRGHTSLEVGGSDSAALGHKVVNLFGSKKKKK